MTLTVISLFARSSAHIHASLQFKADTIHGGKDGAAQEPGMNDLIAVRCIPWYSLQFELITSWLLLPFILYTLWPCLTCPSARILPARRGVKLTLTAVMKACFTWSLGGSIILTLSPSLNDIEKKYLSWGFTECKIIVSLSYCFLERSTDMCKYHPCLARACSTWQRRRLAGTASAPWPDPIVGYSSSVY